MSFLQRTPASSNRFGPEVAAAFRKTFPEHSPTGHFPQEGIRGKRLCAGWDEAVLDGIYATFQAA
ncbi:MAG: hypothetical protein R3C02_01855 [Planctomycetaceae bacterium]